MKKLLLTLSLCTLVLFSFAQSLALSHDEFGSVANGDTLTFSDLSSADEVVAYLNVSNTSAASVNVTVKKAELFAVEGSQNVFCWGSCFMPTTIVSPITIDIDAETTDSTNFSAHLYPYETYGESQIRYTFYVTDDANDSISVVLKYVINEDNSSGIAQQALSVKSYPNPAASLLTIESEAAIQNLAVYNILGLKVLELKGQGAQVVCVNVSDLPAGQYFYKIEAEDQGISTQKFIIKR